MFWRPRPRRAYRASVRPVLLSLSRRPRPAAADEERMNDLAEFTRASLATENPTAYGAQVVDTATGRIVARARNGVLATGDPTAHAEVLAIREACRELGVLDLSAFTLDTTCEPCAMCMGAALWARVGRLVYGFTLGDSAGYFPETSLSARSIAARSPIACAVVGPVARGACLAVLRDAIDLSR